MPPHRDSMPPHSRGTPTSDPNALPALLQRTHTHTHTHIHTRTHTHARTHAHTQTHMHTLPPGTYSLSSSSLFSTPTLHPPPPPPAAAVRRECGARPGSQTPAPARGASCSPPRRVAAHSQRHCPPPLPDETLRHPACPCPSALLWPGHEVRHDCPPPVAHFRLDPRLPPPPPCPASAAAQLDPPSAASAAAAAAVGLLRHQHHRHQLPGPGLGPAMSPAAVAPPLPLPLPFGLPLAPTPPPASSPARTSRPCGAGTPT